MTVTYFFQFHFHSIKAAEQLRNAMSQGGISVALIYVNDECFFELPFYTS